LRDHHSQQLFRAIHGYFANFSRSVGSISEEIYSQQAVYLSYTFHAVSHAIPCDAHRLPYRLNAVSRYRPQHRSAWPQRLLRFVAKAITS